MSLSFSDEHHRLVAIEVALEWLLFRVVSTSSDPKAVLEEFNQHLLEREESNRQFGLKSLNEGRDDIFENSLDANGALSQLREDLVGSIKVGSQ